MQKMKIKSVCEDRFLSAFKVRFLSKYSSDDAQREI